MSLKPKHPITGCRADELIGIWMMDPEVHERLYNLVMNVPLETLIKMREGSDDSSPERAKPYAVNGSTAVVEMSGPITKRPTSFAPLVGGGSTLEATKAVRSVMANENGIDRILLNLESPGGTSAGIADFRSFLQATDKKIPIYVHGSDNMASAAWWIGSVGREVSADQNASVGSMGAYVVIDDPSQKREKEGIKRYVVSSGKMKGLGQDKIDEKTLTMLQERVDGITDLFVKDVAASRHLPLQEVKALADGRVFYAGKAKELKLIDRVSSLDETLEYLNSKSRTLVPSGYRGPEKDPKTTAASEKGVRMYTREQMQQVRNLPGAASVAEEGADVRVLEVAVSLDGQVRNLTTQLEQRNTELSQLRTQVPKQTDPTLLLAQARLATREIELVGKEGKLTGGQVAQMKSMLLKDDKPNAAFLADSGDGNGTPVYAKVLQALEGNKPNGVVGKLSGSQPVPKQEPGSEEGEQKLTLKGLNTAREASGLAPVTKADFEKLTSYQE